MKKQTNLIGWEKWKDPLANATSSYHYDDDDDNGTQLIAHKPSVPMIMTPVGLIPISEGLQVSANFNFWIAHTNFRITKYIKDIIENTSGVEILDVCTPYRMRIGIGKMFKDKIVRRNIGDSLYSYLHNRESIKNDTT